MPKNWVNICLWRMATSRNICKSFRGVTFLTHPVDCNYAVPNNNAFIPRNLFQPAFKLNLGIGPTKVLIRIGSLWKNDLLFHLVPMTLSRLVFEIITTYFLGLKEVLAIATSYCDKFLYNINSAHVLEIQERHHLQWYLVSGWDKVQLVLFNRWRAQCVDSSVYFWLLPFYAQTNIDLRCCYSMPSSFNRYVIGFCRLGYQLSRKLITGS